MPGRERLNRCPSLIDGHTRSQAGFDECAVVCPTSEVTVGAFEIQSVGHHHGHEHVHGKPRRREPLNLGRCDPHHGVLLATKANAIERQADYQRVIDKVELTRIELRSRISDSKMALDKLAAQEAMVKVDRLSTEADALLAQVNELVEGNTRVAKDPVRSVDELLQAAAEQAEAAKGPEPSAALDFLNS